MSKAIKLEVQCKREPSSNKSQSSYSDYNQTMVKKQFESAQQYDYTYPSSKSKRDNKKHQSKSQKQKQKLEIKLINEQSIEILIKQRIYQKIFDISNKTLYPPYMGPHPIYTMEFGKQNDNPLVKTYQLKQKLIQWFWNFLDKKYKNSTKKMKKNENSIKVLESNNKTFDNCGNQSKQQSSEKKGSKRIGTKYKKYSLQFKKQIINKIKMELQKNGKKAKPLRYYICQQASLLGIHPKNITRWFDTDDLQRKQGGRKAKFPLLQYRLARYMQENPTFKRKQIVQQAKKILTETGEAQNFNFSKGWYERFKVRLKQRKVIRSMQRVIFQQFPIRHKSISENNLLVKNQYVNQKISVQKIKQILQEQDLSRNFKNEGTLCKIQDNIMQVKLEQQQDFQSYQSQESSKLKQFLHWRSNELNDIIKEQEL